ncbi:MAG: HIT family protein [Bacteroidales bacterium]
MASIFTRIINGEIPCYKIAEDEKHFAFLDINPLKLGHTLVIPKREVDYIFDLDDREIADLNIFAKKVALAIQKVISCKRIGTCVMGMEVPHAHIHLVPLSSEGDLNFRNKKLNPEAEEMKRIAEQIAAAL